MMYGGDVPTPGRRNLLLMSMGFNGYIDTWHSPATALEQAGLDQA